MAIFTVTWLLYGREQSKPVVYKKAAEPVITISTDKPDESKKNADNYNWRGTAEDPKRIKIGKIAVDAFVQQAGVDQNKAVAVPNNVHLASWFKDSVRPGQLGLSIIDGHVSGKTTDGVFKNLKKLVAGDTYQIEMGNGRLNTYKVVSNQSVKVADAAKVLFEQDPKIKSQLNLITCGGKFNKSQNQFEERVIVVSELSK